MTNIRYVLYNKFNATEKITMDWDGNIRIGAYGEKPLGFSSLEVAWLYLHRLKDVFPQHNLIIGVSDEYNTVSFETKFQNLNRIG